MTSDQLPITNGQLSPPGPHFSVGPCRKMPLNCARMVIIFTALYSSSCRLAAELWLNALNRREVLRHANAAPPGRRSHHGRANVREGRSLHAGERPPGAVARADFRCGACSRLWCSAVHCRGFLRGCAAPRQAQATLGAERCSFYLRACCWACRGCRSSGGSSFASRKNLVSTRARHDCGIVDKLKGLALAGVIGFPLMWGLFALVRAAGGAWWLWGWALLFCFQLLMVVLYPEVDHAALQQAHAAARGGAAHAADGAGGAHRVSRADDRGHRRLEAFGPFERLFHRLWALPAHRAVRHTHRATDHGGT